MSIWEHASSFYHVWVIAVGMVCWLGLVATVGLIAQMQTAITLEMRLEAAS